MYCGKPLDDTRIRGLANVGDSSAASESPTLILDPVSDPDLTTDYRTTSHPEPQPDPPPPERVGCYRLLRKLGTGGMGQVFEAESDDSGERVALKLLSPKLVTNPTSVERFKQEGRLASQISHPRCVFVYGVDADEGRPFIVMELMPGSTLKDLVDKRGPMAWDRAVHRILDVLDGLIEAHRLGMLHRDVKPSNCFLTDDDRVKIGDFGLSKSLDSRHQQKHLTSSGAFLGTVLFASPEQIRGDEVSYDSDVYSVAATLYYLLVGRPPHHHTSMTAALAKAISEPPPSIRAQRPDVPREVERIVFRALDRDRNRRYGSLEEFRDALQDVLPERQRPPRMRDLVSAYLIDVMFCILFLTIPFVVLYDLIVAKPSVADGIEGDWLFLAILIAYFTVSEGWFGSTVGKLLFRLRATRLGQVGRPGPGPALTRTVVFHVIVVALLMLAGVLMLVPAVGPVVGVAVLFAGVVGLFLQRKQSSTQQGVHDYASGCRVVQRPRSEHRPRLKSQFENPLEHPTADPQLPAVVGGFSVRGRLQDLADGAAVWVAEDESLNRRILLWVRPAKLLPDGLPPSPVRPGRLRAVSTGELVWNDGAYGWVAFVAPTGAPLVDVVTKEHLLSWADARMVLEQVVLELQDSEADGSTPARLGVDHLWVEPNGRVHLLEFPIPPKRLKAVPASPNALELVRQVAAVTLEGGVKPSGTGIESPLPPHATRVVERLFRADDPPTLLAMHEELLASHAHQPEVTSGMRTAHLGLVLAISGWALFAAVVLSLGFCVRYAVRADEAAKQTLAVLHALDSPEVVAAWRENSPFLRDVLAPEHLPGMKAALATEHARAVERLQNQRETLSRPERVLADSLSAFQNAPDELFRQPEYHAVAEYRLLLAAGGRNNPEAVEGEARRVHAAGDSFLLVLIVVVFAAFAFAFRGGVSYLLSGIALVRRDGRPAGRWVCALREVVIGAPMLIVLLLNTWVQALHPDWVYVRLGFVMLTVVTFLGYLIVGLRYTHQGPYDELVGTYMVPA
jgi:hypothetical protein